MVVRSVGIRWGLAVVLGPLAACAMGIDAGAPGTDREDTLADDGAGDSTGDGDGAGATSPAGDTDAVVRLVREGPRSIKLGFAEERDVTVQAVDGEGQPLEGISVMFAIAGRQEDTSVAALTLKTGDDGRVTNTLMAGRTDTTFELVASADGAKMLVFEVSVSDGGFGTLCVEAAYDGSRSTQQRTLWLFEGMSCNDALPEFADRKVVLDEGEVETSFLALPAGDDLRYTVLGHAQGETLTVLAADCVEGVVIAADRERTVSLAFEDLPLEPSGDFSLTAMLDAGAPADRLVEHLTERGTYNIDHDALGNPIASAAEAKFLFRALESAWRQLGLVSADASLLEELQLDEASLETLQTDLDGAGIGPRTALAELTEPLHASVSSAGLAGELSVNADQGAFSVAWTTQRMHGAPLRAGADPVVLDMSQEMPTDQGAGRLMSDQDAFAVEQLQTQLPWGALGSKVLLAVTADTETRAEVLSALGCDELATWLAAAASDAPSCDADCWASVCDTALEQLVKGMAEDLANVDAQRPASTLEGIAEIVDTTGDLQVDLMSMSELAGHWLPAVEGGSSDPFGGTLQAGRIEP